MAWQHARSCRCAGSLSLGAALAGFALAGCPAPAPRSGHDDVVVIEDVTVVSPERSASLTHADVVLRDGRIA